MGKGSRKLWHDEFLANPDIIDHLKNWLNLERNRLLFEKEALPLCLSKKVWPYTREGIRTKRRLW